MNWYEIISKELIEKGKNIYQDCKELVRKWKPETEEGLLYKQDLEDIIAKWESYEAAKREHAMYPQGRGSLYDK